MTEQTDSGGCVEAIGIFILIVFGLIIFWRTFYAIENLQRRVGQLEVQVKQLEQK